MPTNQNAYNSRVTSESLEARFRQTFTAQGGAELVDDLYASGVIVPIVDFTAAAEGSSLRSDLQTAFDRTSTHIQVAGATNTFVTTTGFWRLQIACHFVTSSVSGINAQIEILDGLGSTTIWQVLESVGTNELPGITAPTELVVFLKSGESLRATSSAANVTLDVTARQIADINGNLKNPTGFTFS